ncbi:Protein lifeguard 4 [Armadillidium vulgare]|nr:Protein lifeguard 4 [Armadillidium vulgare]
MSFTLQGGFTVAIAATIGVVISVYKVISVIKCLVFTTIIVISLLCLYTLQSNRDYSKLGPFLMTSLTVLLGAGIINLFFKPSRITPTIEEVRTHNLTLSHN